uniref:Uncharacterized protein n=1 Tax=Panagrolaimus sp. JU765 TaxID=591449 RepID=A0AC34R7W1_9BILA
MIDQFLIVALIIFFSRVERYTEFYKFKDLFRNITVSCQSPYVIQENALIELWDEDGFLNGPDDLIAIWDAPKWINPGKSSSIVKIGVTSKHLEFIDEMPDEYVDLYFKMTNVCQQNIVKHFNDVVFQNDYDNTP